MPSLIRAAAVRQEKRGRRERPRDLDLPLVAVAQVVGEPHPDAAAVPGERAAVQTVTLA